MVLLPALAHPLVLGSGVAPATAEAAGHLQQHSLPELPSDIAAADDIEEAIRQQGFKPPAGIHLSSSSGAAAGYLAAAATHVEDVLMGKSSIPDYTVLTQADSIAPCFDH